MKHNKRKSLIREKGKLCRRLKKNNIHHLSKILVMELHHLDGGAGRILLPDILQDFWSDAH